MQLALICGQVGICASYIEYGTDLYAKQELEDYFRETLSDYMSSDNDKFDKKLNKIFKN